MALWKTRQETVRIEDILIYHRKVKKKKVRRYVGWILNKEPVDRIMLTYCPYEDIYYLDDGHHRIVAEHLCGIEELVVDVRDCGWCPIIYHKFKHYKFDKWRFV